MKRKQALETRLEAPKCLRGCSFVSLDPRCLVTCDRQAVGVMVYTFHKHASQEGKRLKLKGEMKLLCKELPS